MPGYKHPCPFCATFIDSGVAACPYCGVIEPFSQGRCPDCRAELQPGWIACPKCGRSLTATDAAAAGAAAPKPPPAATPTPSPAASDAARCTGCGAALPAGARFCTTCGTLAG
jgi:predicted amidophosphoribosyltransferase